MKIHNHTLPLLILGSLNLFAAGCGESRGPDPKIEEARMNSAVEMRKMFDKVGGDYSKLDATDKAEFDKLAGGTSESEKTWNTMKNGPDRGPATGPKP